MNEDDAKLECAVTLALMRLHADLPELAELWTAEDSMVFRAGFAAGMHYLLTELKPQLLQIAETR